MMNFNYGFGLFGLLFTILWWALMIAAAVALVRWITRQSKLDQSTSKALDILRERYARGEINKEEFEERKHLLS